MKDVAVLDINNIVVAVNVHMDDYEVQPYELEVSDETGPAFVGGDYVNGRLYEPQPFPSWTRGDTGWIPPVPRPNEPCFWDEDAQQWVPFI
jgi:hypothetical protein